MSDLPTKQNFFAHAAKFVEGFPKLRLLLVEVAQTVGVTLGMGESPRNAKNNGSIGLNEARRLVVLRRKNLIVWYFTPASILIVTKALTYCGIKTLCFHSASSPQYQR